MIAVNQKITPVFDKTIIMNGSWYNMPPIIGNGVTYIMLGFSQYSHPLHGYPPLLH